MKWAAIVLCLAPACWRAQAGPEKIVCPPAILAATTVARAEGWEAVGGAAQYELESAQLYQGHPNDEVALPPDESANGKDRLAHWRLGARRVDRQGQEFWVGCAYHDTTAILARKLDARLSRCVARYGISGDGPRSGGLQSLTCS